jgi:uncharacterized membrane protein YwaF
MREGLDIIISPVNAVWLCFAGLFILLSVPVYFLLRRKPFETRRRALLMIAAANLALFCVYLLWFQHRPGTPFFRWDMLPLNLCNLVTVLFVVALAANRQFLYRFCFYVGIASGFMAILSPAGALKEMELFSPLMIGFYVVHCMLYMLGISLATLKLYKPTYRSALLTVLYLEILSGVVYVINLLLRNTVYKEANFFFLFETGESSYLKALHGLVPVPPFTMMVSVLPVGIGIFILLTFLYKVITGEHRFLRKG